VTDQFKDNILLTGGTGFVGQSLIKNLNSSVKLLGVGSDKIQMDTQSIKQIEN
jgi:nucleoside-diphosphate-sugar epimerase